VEVRRYVSAAIIPEAQDLLNAVARRVDVTLWSLTDNARVKSTRYVHNQRPVRSSNLVFIRVLYPVTSCSDMATQFPLCFFGNSTSSSYVYLGGDQCITIIANLTCRYRIENNALNVLR
jgi:hypothetical protein